MRAQPTKAKARRPKRPGAITLASVAQRAGVSQITASRVLRHSNLVAPATQDLVLAAARELGYLPNLLARGLVHNRTATVGVVVLELANPFFAPMLSAIHAMAAKRGFLVVVGESGRNEDEERRYVEHFRQLRIGGIIVSPVTKRLDHLAAARASGTPVVVMARRWEYGDYVAANDLKGGRLVAQHLLNRGHRRIGLIRRGDPDHAPIRDRVLGFRKALASAGVKVAAGWDLQVEGGLIQDGMEAVDRILRMSQHPSALFVTSDRMAMGVVHRLLERGVRVPEDVAVIGYDDIPYAESARVPLTTVSIPMQRLGEISAEIMFSRLDGGAPDKPRQVLLPPQLVVRGSCP